MARRARFNIETLVLRLTSQGFVFHSNDGQRDPVVPFRPATAAAPELVAWLESEFGPIPMVLSSWIRLVGDVWFVGSHPRWAESSEADPLVIEIEGTRYPGDSISAYFAGEHEQWEEAAADDPAAGSFVLPVAPDRLHKANVSGGAPYGFRLPDASTDGVFVAEHETSFVSYLNRVFANGGFPAPSPWTRATAGIRKALSEGLLAL
jgi:hypothetical protein